MPTKPCNLLITDTTVLLPELKLQDGAAIAVQGSKIAAIGDSAALQCEYHAAAILDGAGKLAMPGMVDAHTHACQQLLRGRITDEPPMIWVRFLVPFESQLEPEDVYWSAMLCCVEMLKGGVTAFADAGGRHMQEVARAVADSGMRACIARSTMDAAEFVPANMKDSAADAVTRTEELFKAWDGGAGGRVRIWFALRQVMTSTPALVEGVADAARRHATGVHIHLAEHLREVEHCLVNYRLRPAEWLDSLGLLGSNVLAGHCVVLSEREVQLLVQRGTTPVHCPRSNLHSHGFPKTPLFLALGSPIGLGSDGAASSRIDHWENMRLLKSATQARYGLPINDPTVLPVEDALRMATSGGARALMLQDEIGTLQVGKRADIVLVRCTGPHLHPTHNRLRSLVMAATTEDVSDVLVDGKLLLRERRLTHLDEEQIVHKAAEHMQAVSKRAGL